MDLYITVLCYELGLLCRASPTQVELPMSSCAIEGLYSVESISMDSFDDFESRGWFSHACDHICYFNIFSLFSRVTFRILEEATSRKP